MTFMNIDRSLFVELAGSGSVLVSAVGIIG